MAATQFTDTMPPLPSIDGVAVKHIEGTTGYAASSDGNVWTCRSGNMYRKFKTPWQRKKLISAGRYLMVGIAYDGQPYKLVLVQKVILETFVGPRPPGMQACHFPNKDTSDNCVENLRWDTPVGNNGDKKHHGTDSKGERNGKSKLTVDQVASIRQRRAAGESRITLAREHGVTAQMIYLICIGKCWK